jgi:hypothetical protein
MGASRLPRALSDFVARYRAGDYAAWDDLTTQHEAVWQHADLRAEAMAVAQLLMQRVRQNAQQLRATLLDSGAALDDVRPPTPEADLQPLIEVVGPLPIALQAFWTVVGSIYLTPRYAQDEYPDYGECTLEAEGISLLALDPLQIDGVDVDHLLDEHAEGEPLFAGVCPDYLGKQHISGSGPRAIELPAQGYHRLDPDVGDDEHGGLGALQRLTATERRARGSGCRTDE